VKWPYKRRIDPAHAWGVVAVGSAGLVAIPAILATLHATDSQFRWWWPTNWMAIPAAIFLIGVALAALPIRRPEQAARGAAEVRADGTSVVGANRKGADDELPKPTRPRMPAPALEPGHVASEQMPAAAEPAGHAFICYAREDASHVDWLQQFLQDAGIRVWRDTADLWPGQDWHTQIRQAITGNALVFLACFSRASLARARSHQNEELVLAIEQLRLRRPDDPWLIPVRFDDCQIPDRDIGGGRTLASLQCTDLFGDPCHQNAQRLVQAIRRLLGHHDAAAPSLTPTTHSAAIPEVEIGEPGESDSGFSPPVRSVVHVRVSEPISDLTACFVTDQNLGGTTDLGHAAMHVSTSVWRIRSDHLLRSVRDVIIGYNTTENGRKMQRFQWDGHDHEYDSSAPSADGSHLSALHQIKQALRAGQDVGRRTAGTVPAGQGSQPQQPMPAAQAAAPEGARSPHPFPASLTQRTIPLNDGLHPGTMLAIEVHAHHELGHATVLVTGITGPPGAATIPPPARLYWHPARQASATIAQGGSNFINVARTGPMPPGALMDTPDHELPWTLPDGQWQVDLQLTATGYPAMAITATFNVSRAHGFPVQSLEWLTLSGH